MNDGERAKSLSATSENYDASSIEILTEVEAIRQRPAMYLGATGAAGVAQLIEEIVQNAVDEALAGHCRGITVGLGLDGSISVSDDGRGIPVDLHPTLKRPVCELVATRLHSGGKFKRSEGHSSAYGISGGLHGIGLSCVNALSEWLALDIRRDGQQFKQRFERGVVASELRAAGKSIERGTLVHFLPDKTIFGDAAPSYETIARRLESLSYLLPGLKLTLVAPGRGLQLFQSDGGLAAFVLHRNTDRAALHNEPFSITGERAGVTIHAALQWTTSTGEDIAGFANTVLTPRGGTHVDGLAAALRRTLNRFALAHGFFQEGQGDSIAALDARDGLTCALAVTLAEPEFDGQAKAVLTSAHVADAVEQVISKALYQAFETNRDASAAVIGRALEASRARAAARRASERARYRGSDPNVSKEVYRIQFGARSKSWHQSARWITDGDLLARHAELCRVGPQAKVLDVCCGSGVVGAAFRDRVGEITGLDLTPEMARLAATRLDKVTLGDVYDLPFPEATFDLVVNREVLHLLPHPERPVGEMLRVLKPGGQLIVGQLVPYGAVDAPWLFRILKKKQPLFFNNFTAETFRDLLTQSGFTDVEMVEHLQWEDIDQWIDSYETPPMSRHEIRDLYRHASSEIRAAHEFTIDPSGAIHDRWRWCIYSSFKPTTPL